LSSGVGFGRENKSDKASEFEKEKPDIDVGVAAQTSISA